MTDGRYDSRRGQFDPNRGRNEGMGRSSRDDRGFFDRARDEVSSWFGDDVDRSGDRDYRSEDSSRERGYGRYEQNPRPSDEGYRRPYTGNSAIAPDRAPRDFSEGYQPMAGDYARTANRDRSQERKHEQASTATASTHAHDRHYAEWRERQISELDRDYHDYRRENQSRFDSEFSTWRGQRQSKRQLLAQVSEQMEVVGSDDQPLGKVDRVRGDTIILAKSDSSDGRHHSIACSMVDRIEDNKVFLTRPAEEARQEFGTPDRDRALGEREGQGEDGPHMLNRSFSGTY